MTHPYRHHVFLLKELVRRDFHGRYAGSLLSFFWSFIQPLWMLALFSFVFGTVMKLKLAEYGLQTENFGIFLFCGLLPWTAVQEGLQRASTAVTDNAVMVKKLRFPTEILILSVVLGALLHEAIAAVVFMAILALLGQLSWLTLPWLLLALPLQLLLTLGLGLLLASSQVFFRDTAQFVGMVLTGWFYFTPIVYPIDMVPEGFRPWIRLNPLTPLVELYRRALLGETFDLWGATALLAAVAVALAVLGSWLFRRLRPEFVDQI